MAAGPGRGRLPGAGVTGPRIASLCSGFGGLEYGPGDLARVLSPA